MVGLVQVDGHLWIFFVANCNIAESSKERELLRVLFLLLCAACLEVILNWPPKAAAPRSEMEEVLIIVLPCVEGDDAIPDGLLALSG